MDSYGNVLHMEYVITKQQNRHWTLKQECTQFSTDLEDMIKRVNGHTTSG